MPLRFDRKACLGVIAATGVAAMLACHSPAQAQPPAPASTSMQMRQVGAWQVGEAVAPIGTACVAMTFSPSSRGPTVPHTMMLNRGKNFGREPTAVLIVHRDISHQGPVIGTFMIGSRSIVLEGRAPTQRGLGMEAVFEGGDPLTNQVLEQLVEALQQGSEVIVSLGNPRNGQIIGMIPFSLRGSGRALTEMNACGGFR
jgi:invasion protein IalB